MAKANRNTETQATPPGLFDERAMRQSGFEPLKNPDIEKFEVGTKVSGEFVEVRESHGELGGLLLELVDDETGEARVFGVKTMLEQPLKRFRPGDGIAVACIGMGVAKRGQSAPFLFEVYRRPAAR